MPSHYREQAANEDFQLRCWDLAISFVQEPLDVGQMLMATPGGYFKMAINGERTALHVLQNLYGLKQASRLLSGRLPSYLRRLGFKQLVSGRCVFVKGHGRGQLVAATWVDGAVLSSAKENKFGRRVFDKALRRGFGMGPWTSGETDWFLNIKVTRDWGPLRTPSYWESGNAVQPRRKRGKKPIGPYEPDPQVGEAHGEGRGPIERVRLPPRRGGIVVPVTHRPPRRSAERRNAGKVRGLRNTSILTSGCLAWV